MATKEIDTKVVAEVRENFGKGFARRLRAAGKIPAVIYGHGTTPVHVALPGHQVALLIRRANAVLELDVDGTQQLTLVKDVQKDPVHQIIEHIDLLVVKKGEKIQVDVPDLGHRRVGSRHDRGSGRQHRAARGRGHPHPRAHRARRRGPRGGHAHHRGRPHAAQGRVAHRRPRDADRRDLGPVVDARRRGRDRRARRRRRRRAGTGVRGGDRVRVRRPSKSRSREGGADSAPPFLFPGGTDARRRRALPAGCETWQTRG